MTYALKRKIAIASTILVFLFLIPFTFFYISNIKIYEPISIKIINNNQYVFKDISLCVTKPLGGSVTIEKDNINKCWTIQNGYYKEILINLNSCALENKDNLVEIEIFSIFNNDLKIKIKDKLTKDNNIIIRDIPQNRSIFFFRVVPLIIKNFGFIFIFFLSLLAVYLLRKKKDYLVFQNKIITILIIVWGILWLLLASFYSFPNAEDLTLVLISKNLGLIKAAIQTMLIDDGRYFTNILHSINFLVLGGIEFYKFVPITSLILIIFSLYYFIITLFKNLLNKYSALIISSFIIIFHFSIIPSIAHQLFWMVNSFVYLYAWIFLFLWISFFIRLFRSEKFSIKTLYFFLTVITMVCSFGINEMMIVLNIFCLSVLSFYFIKYRNKKIAEILPFFILAAACIFLFISSPGAIPRYYHHVPVKDIKFFQNAFSEGTKQFLSTIIEWLFNNKITLPLFLLSSAFLYKLFDVSYIFLKLKHLIILFLSSFALMYSLTFIFYFSIGPKIYPFVIYNFINWIFLINIFLIAPLIFNKLKIIERLGIEKYQIHITSIILIFILLYFTLSHNNITLIRNDYLEGTYLRYKNEVYKRYETLYDANNNKGWKYVQIDSIKSNPRTIYVPIDITSNNKPQWNKAYIDYFRLDDVRLTTDSTSKYHFIKEYVKK